VHFVKRGGAPVTYIAADDSREAAAVREVDQQRKYYLSKVDSQTHYRYSDNALRRMKQALDEGLDMDAVWAEQQPTLAPGRR